MFRTHSPYELPLGRIAGIAIHAHASIALVGAMWLVPAAFSGSLTPVLVALASVVLLVGSVLVHELGHAIAAGARGLPTERIVLHAFGGVAILMEEPGPADDLRITVAGPLSSAALWLGFAALAGTLSGPLAVTLCDGAARINLALTLFNLVPAYPLDGGRALLAVLRLRRPSASSPVRTALTVGCWVAGPLAIWTLVQGSVLGGVVFAWCWWTCAERLISLGPPAAEGWLPPRELAIDWDRYQPRPLSRWQRFLRLFRISGPRVTPRRVPTLREPPRGRRTRA